LPLLESLKEVSQNIQNRIAKMGNAAAMGSFVQEDILPGSPLIKREQSNLDTGKCNECNVCYRSTPIHTNELPSQVGAGMMTPQQTPKNTSPSQQSPSIGNIHAIKVRLCYKIIDF
jgi:hypothetical protein